MMDFTDPAKKRAHTIRLFIGYFLIAIAIGLCTLILVYRADGYNYDNKTHSVIQNGLLFLDAKPDPAAITINGKLRKEKTDARLDLAEGTYTVKLSRSGYRTWEHDIILEGGKVERYDYPLLFPEKLATTEAEVYAAKPGLVTQSPDRRWLLTHVGGDMTVFGLRDLTNSTSVPTELRVPPSLYDFAGGTIELVEWGSDNQHVLLAHSLPAGGDGAAPRLEYVVIDRSDPTQSININRILGINPAKVVVRDGHWDQLYIYDAVGGIVRTAELKTPVISGPILTDVLDFKPQGNEVLLYVTTKDAPAGKAFARIRNNDKNIILREITSSSKYFLEATKYDGHNYYAVSSVDDTKTQIFRDPLSREARKISPYIPPFTVLRAGKPEAVTVAYGGRYIAMQSGTQFVVFDIDDAQTYRYTLTDVVVAGSKVTWLDNYRLSVHTDKGLKVMDYDGTNQQLLLDTAPDLPVYLDRDSETLYSFLGTQQAPRYALQRSVLRLVNQ